MVVKCYRLGGITSGKAADHWLSFSYFHAPRIQRNWTLEGSSLGTDRYPRFDESMEGSSFPKSAILRSVPIRSERLKADEKSRP